MRNPLLCGGVFVLILAGIISVGSPAQEKGKGGKKMPSQEEMMKRWQESMTPGVAHNAFENFVGSWDAETKTWMSGPGPEPAISKGTSDYTLTFGGRFLQQQYAGEMMGQRP